MYINEFVVNVTPYYAHAMLSHADGMQFTKYKYADKIRPARTTHLLKNHTLQTMNVIHVRKHKPNERNVRGCAVVRSHSLELMCAHNPAPYIFHTHSWHCALRYAAVVPEHGLWNSIFIIICVIVQQVQALKCENWFASKTNVRMHGEKGSKRID